MFVTGTMVSLLVGTGVISLIHGLLPNHWLPFVLIGRGQGWTMGRMLKILSAAGAAHIAVSAGIALLALTIGLVMAPFIESISHILPGIILLAVGLLYVWLDLTHHGHDHHRHHELHEAASHGLSERTATITLVLSLALSPCEAMVPIFVSAAPIGSVGLLLALVVISGIASLLVMIMLSSAAWRGMTRLDFGRFAHRERLIMGVTLTLLGVVTFGLAGLGHG